MNNISEILLSIIFRKYVSVSHSLRKHKYKKKNFFFNLVLQQMNNDIGQADYVIHF